MEQELKPTAPSRVAPPRESQVVELAKLRDMDGNPVRVMVLRVRGMKMGDAVGAFPGSGPEPEPGQNVDPLEMERRAERVIELATATVNEAGEIVTPAFWFTEEKPGAMPGAWLTDIEKMLLASAAMELNGYAGAATEAGRFPGGDRRRVGDGRGPVGAGEAGAQTE